MQSLSRSALVQYSSKQMYRLVTGIEQYPQFLNWCSDAEILLADNNIVEARVDIELKGIKQSFSTRNTNQPFERIEMALIDGPFSQLSGEWRFTELAENACKVELDLNFDFNNVVLAKLLGPVFSQISANQIEAFQQRAKQVYG